MLFCTLIGPQTAMMAKINHFPCIFRSTVSWAAPPLGRPHGPPLGQLQVMLQQKCSALVKVCFTTKLTKRPSIIKKARSGLKVNPSFDFSLIYEPARNKDPRDYSDLTFLSFVSSSEDCEVFHLQCQAQDSGDCLCTSEEFPVKIASNCVKGRPQILLQ